MNENPLVSVVVPVYNRARLLGRALGSVLGQTMRDFELIVVDDGSTDDSVAVAESFAADPRVRLCPNPVNLGAAGARNRGIELARGRYVAFQDSDDRWFPEKLARQLEALAAAPRVRAAFCGAVYFSREQCYAIPRSPALRGGEIDLARAILYDNPTTPQTLLVERELLVSVGGFDRTLRINEDWDLVLRLAQEVAFGFVDEPLVMLYRTPGSVSSDRRADALFRLALVERYGALFARERDARARQRYIAGCLLSAEGRPVEAARALLRSFRDAPRGRTLAQVGRAFLPRRRPASPRGGAPGPRA